MADDSGITRIESNLREPLMRERYIPLVNSSCQFDVRARQPTDALYSHFTSSE